MSKKTELLKLVTDTFESIWNDRMAGSVYSLYLHNARIFQGVNYDHIYGRENYLSRVVETFSMLPDLTFEIEKSFSDEEGQGDGRVYLRWVLEGTHLGAGFLGMPTGKRIRLEGMSLCHLSGGRVIEQYDVINNGNLSDQLDRESDEFLEGFYCEPPLFDPASSVLGETGRITGQDLPGDYHRLSDSLSVWEGRTVDADYLRDLLSTVWNLRSPGIVGRTHSEECTFALPGYDEILGNGDYTEFVFSMISAFPDMKMYIDEVITDLKTKSDGYAAVRCTLQGFHGGAGRYGEPVNRQVTIPVIIEYQFEKNHVKSERLCMSEFELIKYLYSYRRREQPAEGDREERVEE